MSGDRGYSAGKFMLEIEGKTAGFLFTAEGGEPYATVVSEPVSANQQVMRKHIGSVEFAPIRISFDTGMSKPLYQWMAEAMNRQMSPRNGAIIFLDYKFNERSRLEFDNALISVLAFPALDAASKDDARFTLTLQPEATRIINTLIGSSVHAFTKTQKRWLTNNFRLRIAGLEVDCSKVNMIDAIIVKLQTKQSGQDSISQVLEIPNITFTLAENFAGRFYDWFEDFVIKGHNAQSNERTGTLEFLDPSLKITLFTLKLSNLGIFRIWKMRNVNGVGVIERVGVELYCEEMAFSSAAESTGFVVASTAPSANVLTTSPVSAQLAEALLGFLSSCISEEEALHTNSCIVRAPKITESNETIEFEQIAKRLLASARPVVGGSSLPMYDDGTLLGERWATEKATLEELEQVAALESGEWTSIRLESAHSLIVHLSEESVLPPDEYGPIDLERDNFVEGIVAGASHVLCNAAPHLNLAKHNVITQCN